MKDRKPENMLASSLPPKVPGSCVCTHALSKWHGSSAARLSAFSSKQTKEGASTTSLHKHSLGTQKGWFHKDANLPADSQQGPQSGWGRCMPLPGCQARPQHQRPGPDFKQNEKHICQSKSSFSKRVYLWAFAVS